MVRGELHAKDAVAAGTKHALSAEEQEQLKHQNILLLAQIVMEIRDFFVAKIKPLLGGFYMMVAMVAGKWNVRHAMEVEKLQQKGKNALTVESRWYVRFVETWKNCLTSSQN